MPLIRKPPATAAPKQPAASPDRIRAALASDDEQLRWNAARAAAGHADCSAALAAALPAEASARVRGAMFTSLAQNADDTALNALQQLLRSDEADLRIGALDALRLVVRERSGLIAPLLDDDDPDVRILACELVRELPSSDASALLCELLGHESEPNVCAAAVDVLAEAGDSSALAALTACAGRFTDTPFLGFAIGVAIDRIRAQPPRSRG